MKPPNETKKRARQLKVEVSSTAAHSPGLASDEEEEALTRSRKKTRFMEIEESATIANQILPSNVIAPKKVASSADVLSPPAYLASGSKRPVTVLAALASSPLPPIKQRRVQESPLSD
jgi:hypothetical protein